MKSEVRAKAKATSTPREGEDEMRGRGKAIGRQSCSIANPSLCHETVNNDRIRICYLYVLTVILDLTTTSPHTYVEQHAHRTRTNRTSFRYLQ